MITRWPPPGPRLASRRSTTASPSKTRHNSPSVRPGGYLLGVVKRLSELGAAGDAELAEDLVQVVLHGAGADEQPGGDLPVGQLPGHHPGDQRLLRREHLRGSGAARPGPRAGGL